MLFPIRASIHARSTVSSLSGRRSLASLRADSALVLPVPGIGARRLGAAPSPVHGTAQSGFSCSSQALIQHVRFSARPGCRCQVAADKAALQIPPGALPAFRPGCTAAFWQTSILPKMFGKLESQKEIPFSFHFLFGKACLLRALLYAGWLALLPALC